ncbi:putative spore germination protein GerPC [Paraliobacillus sp. PM-2]|uniref:spore germination protein GerPC n=1 Tax=Paraliobacillus sp. PM-2 TaxID=1462524 RepID=UPI00061BD3C0|nr:spore germination protein GerPC [Paraliobacillus sp. PM-2]CQR47011.1 putative spore germination protein GerPC [Paraliobacillus sp. PM-2]
MDNDAWYHYIEQLHAYIKKQDQTIRDLSTRMNDLESQQKNIPSNTIIEKLEYHFDQLKIERMDGTLHIGFTPEDLANVEDFSVPLQQRSKQKKQVDPLLVKLEDYVNGVAPNLLNQMALEENRPIDETKKELIIQDICNQLSERVSFYKKEAEKQQIQQNVREPFIFNKVKEEIDYGLREYFKKRE